jgi:hypothetical protein
MADIHALRGRAIVSACVGAVAGATALSWGWNRIAADLAGLPEAGFVHGIAALAATAAVAGIAAVAMRLVSGRYQG